ncbi:hypothetical protein ACIRSS_46550 [Amycolatopsis sp. NPDC101161]|uniref:hypothetical protein n=1 Tax=Amycolatopsis sp. NPDC101161 TaxID=3363940 RepID=UPI00380FEB0D
MRDLFRIPPAWGDDKIRRHVRTEMWALRDEIPHPETAAEKKLRPDNLDEFNRVFDGTFNLTPTFDNTKAVEERWKALPLSVSEGKRYKAIFVSELAQLTLAAGFIPKVELEITAESEPEVPDPAEVEKELPTKDLDTPTEVVPEEKETPEPKRKKSVTIPMPAVYAICAVVAIVLGGGAAFLYLSQMGNNETPQGTDQDLIFDDLGASFNTIKVFPGTSWSDTDQRYNAMYTNGETARATCKHEGRMAHTDTAKGEPDRSSNHWFKIVPSPGNQAEYARAIYTKNGDELWAKLPDCTQ